MSDANNGTAGLFAKLEPASLGETAFLASYYTVYLIILVPSLALLLARRHHRMISPRTVPTLFIFQVFQFIFSLTVGISIIMGKGHEVFCPLLDAMYVMLPFFSLHFSLNIPTLVMNSDLNAQKVSRATNAGKEGTSDHAIFTNIKYVSFPAKMVYMCLTGAAQVGVFLCLRFLLPDHGILDGECNRASLMALSGHILGYMLLLGYFLIRLNKVEDPFYMRAENNWGSFNNIVSLLMIFTYPWNPSIYPAWYDVRYVFIPMSTSSLLVNLVFPLALTNKRLLDRLEKATNKRRLISPEQRKELDTKGTIFALNQGVDVFQAVLSNGTLLEAFTRFTVAEWSVENVLFYKAVEDFQQNHQQDPAKALARAQHITSEFIVTGAPIEVNLDMSIKKDIIRSINSGGPLDPGIFNAAQKSIYQLMLRDSFAKWQQTVEFKKALEKVVDGRNSSSKGSSSYKGSSYDEVQKIRIELTPATPATKA